MAAITAKLRKLTMDEAIAQPIDAPLRFKRGDRCECRCGECWYAATVVQTWWQPTGERTKMPYQCELDAGGLVWAPLDFDMCIREAPPPPPPRAHIVRAKPGVSKEVYGKFFGPGRACSGCDAEVGPMAVSRDLGGRSAFTGIVRYGTLDLLPDESSVAGASAGPALVKLDDPDGALDGPGHAMDDDELLSEFVHYDGGGSPPGWVSPPFKDLRDKDASLLGDGERGRFADETFPFDVRDDGSLRARVRAGDAVKVIYERDQPLPLLRKLMKQAPELGDVDGEGRPTMAPTIERQWLTVVSVAKHGVVTARPQPGGVGPAGAVAKKRAQHCFKFSPELTSDKYCYFPCDRILAMKKASNW